MTCAQSVLLAAQPGRLPEALAWTVRCVSLSDEILHPSTGTGSRALARLTGQLGMVALDRTWRDVTAEELPKAVRDYMVEHIRKEGDAQ